jgi:hypothetical protein
MWIVEGRFFQDLVAKFPVPRHLVESTMWTLGLESLLISSDFCSVEDPDPGFLVNYIRIQTWVKNVIYFFFPLHKGLTSSGRSLLPFRENIFKT